MKYLVDGFAYLFMILIACLGLYFLWLDGYNVYPLNLIFEWLFKE